MDEEAYCCGVMEDGGSCDCARDCAFDLVKGVFIYLALLLASPWPVIVFVRYVGWVAHFFFR